MTTITWLAPESAFLPRRRSIDRDPLPLGSPLHCMARRSSDLLSISSEAKECKERARRSMLCARLGRQLRRDKLPSRGASARAEREMIDPRAVRVRGSSDRGSATWAERRTMSLCAMRASERASHGCSRSWTFELICSRQGRRRLDFLGRAVVWASAVTGSVTLAQTRPPLAPSSNAGSQRRGERQGGGLRAFIISVPSSLWLATEGECCACLELCSGRCASEWESVCARSDHSSGTDKLQPRTSTHNA